MKTKQNQTFKAEDFIKYSEPMRLEFMARKNRKLLISESPYFSLTLTGLCSF